MIKTSGQAPPQSALLTIDQLTKHTLAFGKFFRRLQQPAVPKFVALPGCSDLVLYYWRQVIEANSGPVEYIGGLFSFSDTECTRIDFCILDAVDSVYHTRALLQGMVLFKDCLGQWTPTKQANLDRGNRTPFLVHNVRLRCLQPSTIVQHF